jgi:hypothetical protein
MEAIEGKEQTDRFLHLASTTSDNFVAKARSVGGDIEPIKNPSYTKLMKILEGSANKLNFED